MILSNYNSLCKESELYYYDFLCSDRNNLVSESIINHIEKCQHCQGQIEQLELMLPKADDKEPVQCQADNTATATLQLHFSYINKHVTCNDVKPFLPTLLDPLLEVRIPTPITVHLDKCQRCSEELKVIRSLNLSRIQLCRLSQLFADKDTVHGMRCAQTHASILKILAMNLQETNAEDLKHISMCPYCRKLLYQYRETWRNELLKKKIDQRFPCREVSASDIFDYVVPYGLDPAKDQYAKFRESLATHLHNCPTCLAKMQQLHNTAYGIAKRPESGVVTIYHIDEFAKTGATGETNQLYAGFPIRVEVIGQKDKIKDEQQIPIVDFALESKRKISEVNLKFAVKRIAVAAAVILIGIGLFLNIPTAKAVTIEQIYKALEKVKNVYIASFVPDKKEQTQEIWISRSLNMYMIKTEKQLVLWDITNGVEKIRHIDTAVAETKSLADDIIGGIEVKMSGSLGLVPFYDISEVPPDAQWSRVYDQSIGVAEGIEVYDLKWAKHSGSVLFQWRLFVDTKTSLPKRTEFYQKLVTDDDYVFMSSMEVEYLSEIKMQNVIKETSFQEK